MNIKLIGQILVGLTGAFLLFNGLRYMFLPEQALVVTQLTPDSAFGLNNVRANIGGAAAAFGLIGLHAAVKANTELVRAFITFFVLFIISRITGLVVDGIDPSSVRATILGVGLLAANVVGLLLMKRAEKHTA